MKLTIFDKNNSGTTSARTGVRSVYINRKTGNISFSNTLKKGKGITVEQTVYFAKDEDSKTGRLVYMLQRRRKRVSPQREKEQRLCERL